MLNRYILSAWLWLCALTTATAQQLFFNLTADEVKIDSVVPVFAYSLPLGDDYADSVYTVSVAYPEYIDMSTADVRRLQQMGADTLPELPQVESTVVVTRKRGALEMTLVPLVKRHGKYQKMVSFMLDVKARARRRAVRRARAQAPEASTRYAANSRLATGKWAKIQVSESGIHQLTEALIKQAGFTDLERVHIYGYGGSLQPDKLDGDYLASTDDLQEVAQCLAGGRRLFRAQGPVSWESATVNERTRNPYSNYGCYFITQTDSAVQTVDSATFVSAFYPSADDYHALHEVDNYAWYSTGRDLFEDQAIMQGSSASFTIATPGLDATAQITVRLTAGTTSTAQISVNDSLVGTQSIAVSGAYVHGGAAKATYTIYNIGTTNTVTITTTSGGPVRPDYISATFATPAPMKALSTAAFPVPEYVYGITNQNHHADPQADMVIIIPTSQKLLEQARRLQAHHEVHDDMTVNIVPADELYNEYSSGTPDANAYRRYMKMLYDRAGADTTLMPRYLLLMGDGAWDNRMNSSSWSGYSPDDFLLCYENDDAFTTTGSFVNEGFFCCLDDGEGASPAASDKEDIAVGRYPVRTAAEAEVLVDKTIAYANNENAGGWQNVAMFMGDDGDENQHMSDADNVASLVETLQPAIRVKRVMWDAYTMDATSTGITYPDATAAIKTQQQEGALIMDYSGHGSEVQLSHEKVLQLADFEGFTNKNLPLWITASCDIAPFDGQTDNIGETAMLNANGGAVAFIGTTRTVYVDRNRRINRAILRALFTQEDGSYVALGEALRLAKNSLISGGADGTDRTINKLQYVLLGDPALRLHIPVAKLVVDSINGTAPGADTIRLKALSVATVKGHVEMNGERLTDFNGLLSATVSDAKQLVTCKRNQQSEAETAFTYYDRNKLYSGTDSVRNGAFEFTFAVTKDISYSDDNGLINLYAVNTDKTLTANGYTTDFIVGGTASTDGDSIGPRIYCYLNTPSFVNGGDVNTTPYFVATVKDESGINTSGAGIGHDMTLVIDDDASKTYVLNDYFTFDEGSYTTGQVAFSIPALEPGMHTLKFRAWDVNNNSATATLSFNVVSGLAPDLISVALSRNPASETTTFIINHNMAGTTLDVDIDVYDVGGRLMWSHSESGASASTTYTVDWDLVGNNGARLQTGVYVYRVRISNDGSTKASQAQKLIVAP